MGIFDRLGNLVKGSVAIAKGGTDPVDAAARERALREELERITPSAQAHDELRRRKAGEPVGAPAASAPAAAPGAAGDAPLQVELKRLQVAFDQGVLTRAEYDRKRAEAVARQDAAPDDDTPEIKRTL